MSRARTITPRCQVASATKAAPSVGRDDQHVVAEAGPSQQFKTLNMETLMKRILVAAVALTALGVAAPAFASQSEVSSTITVNAENPAKCDISATSATVTLASDSISDANGMLSGGFKGAVVNALNQNGLSAWCTGAHNRVVVSRSALQTGDGTQDGDQFAKAVIYDVILSMNGAQRDSAPTDANLVDGTEDGATNDNGPNVKIGAFGPTGAGSAMVFSYEDSAGDPTAVSNGQGTGELNRGAYNPISGFRLVAGTYTGTVTIAITPGL